MSLKNWNFRYGVLLLVILAAGIIRILSNAHLTPLSAINPLGAMALFGGAYFSQKWKSFAFPMLCLFLSDVVLMQVFYKSSAQGLLYSGWIWNYISFAAIVVIGQFIKKVSVRSVVFAALGATVTHWLISDFGVWVSGSTDITTMKPFTRDMAGLIKCYTLAIPYMKSMLVGTLVYGAIFFGGFELAQRRFPVLAVKA